MIQRNESGNALIFAIAISALALVILLMITSVVGSQINLASAFTYKVKTGTQKQNWLSQSLQADTTQTDGDNKNLANRGR